MPFKAKNNREAVVVCAIHVVKRPSKRSVLVSNNMIPFQLLANFCLSELQNNEFKIPVYDRIMASIFERWVLRTSLSGGGP